MGPLIPTARNTDRPIHAMLDQVTTRVAAVPRMQWIDVARALCVLAVVLMHSTISLDLVMDFGPLESLWARISGVLQPFRMPTLSLLSGMLLSTRILSGWSDRRLRASIAQAYWAYVVWLVVFLAAAQLIGWSIWLGPFGMGSLRDVSGTVVDQLLIPRSVLWYVIALVIWSLVLTAVRRVPSNAVLMVLTAVSVASFYLPHEDGTDQYRNLLRYAVFFAVGVYFSGIVRDAVTYKPRLTAIVAFAAFGTASFIAWFGVDVRLGNILTVPRDVSGALIAMLFAVLLTKLPGVGAVLAWIGQRTLPIYVMHGIILDLLVISADSWLGLTGAPAVRAMAPVAAAVVVSVVAIVVHEIAVRTPAKTLFYFPDVWRARTLRPTNA